MATIGMTHGMGGRLADLPRALTLVTGWAAIAGLGSIGLAVPAMLDGEVFGFTRAAIGLLGVAAAALVVSGRWIGLDGRQALMLWVLAQLPVYADTPGGNLFRQLFEVPLAMTSTVRINGEITSYSQLGVNVVAIVLAIVIARQKDAWMRYQRERTATAA